MKTSHKIIVTSLLVTAIPVGLFAYDKYENRGYKNQIHMDCDRIHDRDKEDRDMVLPKGTNYVFEGKLEALPKDGLNGTWQISGKKVIVDNNTKIFQEDRNFKIKDEIEVIAKREGNTIKALEIAQE